jgi:P pilus assembly chaperone PapD
MNPIRRWTPLLLAGFALSMIALGLEARGAAAQILAQVTPVKYNLTVKPGEPISRDVQVSNMGDAPVIVRVRLSDWKLNDLGELSLAPLGSTPTSVQGLVRFEPTEFSLAAGEVGLIHVTLQLPADGPATRWGVLLSEIRPASPKPQNLGPRAVAELGTTLYLSRIAPEVIHPELTGMDVIPTGRDSIEVSVRMRNTGERHYYVTGEIALTDSTGASVASGTFGTGVVLPGGKRNFTWTCTPALKPGRYTVTATLDSGEPELMVGEASFRWPMPRRPSGPLAERSPH